VYKRITLVGPVVSALTSKAAEPNHVVELKLHCGGASCRGTITLYAGRDLVALRSYAMMAGTTSSWATHLGTKAAQFLANLNHPTLRAIETVTVTDGRTIQRQISLVR
jgi:hypothetical protein